MLLKKLFLLVCGLVIVLPSMVGYAQDDAESSMDITIRFAAIVGNDVVACGQEYADVGAGNTTIEIADFRFYIYDIYLLDAENTPTPFQLEQDGLWQFENIALLDFEDGTGRCEFGTAALNASLEGTAPVGEYVGLMFKVGIPFERNHADVTTAPSPLNLPSLWWNWQIGYKFMRIDILTADTDVSAWNIHLGSTGCDSAAAVVAPAEICSRPNVPAVMLENFDFENDVVVADLTTLLSGINLAENDPMPPGCQSGFDDPDCPTLFENLGMSVDNGACVDDCLQQTFFHVANRADVIIIEDVNMTPDMSGMDLSTEDHSAHGHDDSEAEIHDVHSGHDNHDDMEMDDNTTTSE